MDRESTTIKRDTAAVTLADLVEASCAYWADAPATPS
jgi:hypothetical protein